MKTNNEQYRNFNKNLLVYMSPDIMPKVDYAEIKGMQQAEVKNTLPQNPKNGDEFKRDADDLLDKVHLDARLDEESPEEKQLKEQIKNHVESEFKLLEHNYQLQLNKIGRGNEAAKKTWEAFNRAAETFMYQMEMYVLERSLKSNDKEGAKEAKIRLLDEQLRMEGLGRYLLEANPNIVDELLTGQYSNPEEFKKKLAEKLDNEEVLEATIKKLFERGPKINTLEDKIALGVKAEFERLVNKSIKDAEAPGGNDELRLTYSIGSDNQEKLVNMLTMRFGIGRNKDGSVNNYVDLMEDNTVYLPGTKEFDDHLRDICHGFNTTKEIDKYNEAINKKAEEQWTRRHELLEGLAGKDYEVEGLDDIKNNRALAILLDSTMKYEEAKTAPERETQSKLAVLKDIKDKTQRENFQTQISDKFRSNDWMGAAGALAALVALINEVSDKKEKGKLEMAEIGTAINRNENPLEKRKEAKDLYLENLKNKKPEPEIADLINAATNENTGYLKSTDKDAGKKNELMANYKSQRIEAIKEYMSDKTKLKITEIDSDGKVTTDKFAFKISGDGNTVEIFTKTKEGDKETQKTIRYAKFNELKVTLATLGDTLSQIKDTKEKKDKTEKETKQKAKQYEDALKTLVSTKSVKGLSKLGKLVEKVTSLADEYPKSQDAKEALKKTDRETNKDTTQQKLDEMRAEFIARNIDKYEVFIKQDKELMDKIKKPEATATTAIAQSTEKPKIDLSAIS